MSMDLNEVRKGLAKALESIGSLNTYAYTPTTINAPAAIVASPVEISWDLTMHRGLDQYEMQVVICTSLATQNRGQELIAEYCASSGAKSVKEALERDRTLGGACSTLRVHSFTDFNKLIQFGEAQYLSLTANITITG